MSYTGRLLIVHFVHNLPYLLPLPVAYGLGTPSLRHNAGEGGLTTAPGKEWNVCTQG